MKTWSRMLRMRQAAAAAVVSLLFAQLLFAQLPPLPGPATFAPGDVIVSLENGPVQWWLPDGTFRATIAPTVPGTSEGMAFDAAGNLYVTHWCVDPSCSTGNTVEIFNNLGVSQGTVGRGYNCNPHTILFDGTGASYVGQAGCQRSLLKFMPGVMDPTSEYMLAPDNQGVFWIDLAPDGCTMYYTSYGPNVKRFNVCKNAQLANFNAVPLPGGATQDLRVLPGGGVLVSSGQVIARLNASGAFVQTYQVPEDALWSGLDLVGDGTFWAGNYYSSNVYRFNLASGTVIDSFNTGAPPNNVVGIRVKK